MRCWNMADRRDQDGMAKCHHHNDKHMCPNSYNNIRLIEFVCGGIAGSISKTLVAPLDRVKILFQTAHPQYPYDNVFRTTFKIAKHEGFRMLWKGNIAAIARVFPYSAFQFSTFSFFNTQFIKLYTFCVNSSPNHSDHIHEYILVCIRFLSGSLAGVCSVIATYPLDLLRTRIASEVRTRTYRGVIHGISKMKTDEGISRLYTGIRPTILGIIPYAGTNFCTFYTLQHIVRTHRQDHEVGHITRVLMGGITGAIGQTVAYPWDVVRRRMQISGFIPGVTQSVSHHVWHSIRYIIKKEGIRALYAGISINYIRVCPASGISFAVYEGLRSLLLKF